MKLGYAPILALVCLLDAVCAHANASAQNFGITKQRSGEGSWQLVVETDRFSGRRRCALRSRDHRVLYVPGALAFRMRGAISPTDAQFRIDDGVAVSVRDQLPELARRGVATERTNIGRSPRIFLPVSTLAGASSVAISPKFGARPHVFPLIGFANLYARAIAIGCHRETWTVG